MNQYSITCYLPQYAFLILRLHFKAATIIKNTEHHISKQQQILWICWHFATKWSAVLLPIVNAESHCTWHSNRSQWGKWICCVLLLGKCRLNFMPLHQKRCARIDAEASTDNLLAEQRAINKRKFHILLLCFVYFLFIRLLCAVGALSFRFSIVLITMRSACVYADTMCMRIILCDLEKPLKCI